MSRQKRIREDVEELRKLPVEQVELQEEGR